jgi:hypothetical protein
MPSNCVPCKLASAFRAALPKYFCTPQDEENILQQTSSCSIFITLMINGLSNVLSMDTTFEEDINAHFTASRASHQFTLI